MKYKYKFLTIGVLSFVAIGFSMQPKVDGNVMNANLFVVDSENGTQESLQADGGTQESEESE